MATSVGAASGKEEDNIHSDVLLFNRWSYDDVEGCLCDCGGLHNCNRIQATYMPHTAGRYQRKCFRKAQCPIVERLTNSLMMHGRNNGKKLMAVPIVKHAVEIINLLTDLNPIQVNVDAVINTCARESAFSNIKTLPECLADELINAAKAMRLKRMMRLKELRRLTIEIGRLNYSEFFFFCYSRSLYVS